MDESEIREIGWLLGAGALFLALWVAIFQAMARIGGWRELAAAYPPLGITGAGLGEPFRMRSLQLRRATNYNHCVTLTAGPAALRLSLPRVFAWGHPPIEVPWAEISVEASRGYLFPVVILHCARTPAAPVRMRRGLAEALARASGGQLRLPAATTTAPER
jgi:hypothetical protein